MQRHEDLIQESGFIRKKACLSTSSRVRYYRSKRAIVVGTTRGRVRSRCSMQVSARKLGATFWKMNETPLSEVMELKKKLQGGENLSAVLSPSASVSHLSDHTPCASVPLTEINYQAQTPREAIVGVRTRLKDVNNALVTSKELLKIIDRILAHNDQLTSSMSLVSALLSELERACLQLNQLLKEQRFDHRETSYLVKCVAEERASHDSKQQQAVESGELKAERKQRCQYERLNSKLGRELTGTKIAFPNTMKKLESKKKERKRTEQVCHELASDIGHKEFEREHKILQVSGKLGGKKVHTKLSEFDQFDEKNGVVEKLRNQFEALFKSKKSEKTNCDKMTTYASRTHFRSNKNEEKEYGGEVGDTSAESDLHSIELNMDNKRGSFKWTRTSTAARDVLSSEDEMKARKYISEIDPRKSSYIQGSVSDGFQRGSYTRTTPSSVNWLQQERFYGLDKIYDGKVDKCELLGHKSVEDCKDKILSSSSLGSGGEFTSPIHSQYFGHVIEERTCSMQRLSTKLRLGGNQSRTKLYP